MTYDHYLLTLITLTESAVKHRKYQLYIIIIITITTASSNLYDKIIWNFMVSSMYVLPCWTVPLRVA